ncbi:MAG: phosphoribosylanthranilate isomerase [Novosphingobium sp.]
MTARPAIKICGITTMPALDAAIAARASHVGFNFYPPSPRYADPALARELSRRAEGHVIRVGVFVDAADALLAEVLAAAPLDALQFHGSESPERVAQARAQFGLPVWKVLSVSAHGDLAKAQDYAGAADFLLLDAKTPKGTLPGGMGLSFDWGLLSGWKAPLPWGLAGGLSPRNVADAVRQTGAPLVDTASGVESAPGLKDADMIATFCNAARGT